VVGVKTKATFEMMKHEIHHGGIELNESDSSRSRHRSGASG
jgi:hypothetical protein